MATRTYKRDARGRFAGGGGGGGKGGGGKPAAKAAKAKPAKPASTGRGGPRGGKVGTRAEHARAKKAQQQRQATFASKATAGREAKARAKLARSQARATGRAGAASGIRRTGGLQTVKPASNIRPTTGPRRGPIGGARNAIRTFNPKTNRAKADQMKRQIDRIGREIKSNRDKIKGGASRLMEAKRRFDRGTARDLVDSKKPGLTGELARLTLSFASPRMVRGAQNVIRSRAARARAVAERGGKAGKRALEIYGNQLAFTGAGKTPRGAKNKIVPGPRSTQPPAKPKRRAKPKTLGDVVGISAPATKPKAKPKPKPKPPGKPKPPSKPRKPKPKS